MLKQLVTCGLQMRSKVIKKDVRFYVLLRQPHKVAGVAIWRIPWIGQATPLSIDLFLLAQSMGTSIKNV